MSIKIYGDTSSADLSTVATAAAMMDIAVEYVGSDRFDGETASLSLSPVLLDGDFVLSGSAAINLYLAEKAGSDLAGTTTRERFHIHQWMFWSAEQWRLLATLSFDIRAGEQFPGQPAGKTVHELAADVIRVPAAILNAHLATRNFMVGGRLTLADLDIAGPVSANPRTTALLNPFPSLSAWQKRVVNTLPGLAGREYVLDVGSDTRPDATKTKH